MLGERREAVLREIRLHEDEAWRLRKELRFHESYAGRLVAALKAAGRPMRAAELVDALDRNGGLLTTHGKGRVEVICRALAQRPDLFARVDDARPFRWRLA